MIERPIRRWRRIPVHAITVLALLVTTSCVSMVGQRITIHHDAAADRLDLLICTDGIAVKEEASAGEESTDFAAKVDQFLAEGGAFLIFSPTGYLEVQKPHAPEEDEDLTPETRAARQMFEPSVEVEQLGLYTDLDGRLGVAQRVSLTDFAALLDLIDSAVNAELLKLRSQGSQQLTGSEDGGIHVPQAFMDDAPKTRALWFTAADDGHRWFDIDGHALVARFPVDPEEFAEFAPDVLRGMRQVLGPPLHPPDDAPAASPPEEESGDEVGASGPWSFRLARQDQRIDVEVWLGERDRPSTFRWHSPKEAARYATLPGDGENAVLRAAIRERMDTDWHATLVAGDAAPWVPAEEEVRALIAAASADAGIADAAQRRLHAVAAAWNTAHRRPPAPTGDTLDLDAWTSWYRAIVEPPSHRD